MKPLIVGQAPGRGYMGQPLVSGRVGRRLEALCGLSEKEFAATFDRVNLLSTYPGKSGKGDSFPIDEARESFVYMMPAFLHRKRVVLLGHNVGRVAGLNGLPYLRWHNNFAICPHPSGVNRWWNDEKNVRKARRFWRTLVRETKCDGDRNSR